HWSVMPVYRGCGTIVSLRECVKPRRAILVAAGAFALMGIGAPPARGQCTFEWKSGETLAGASDGAVRATTTGNRDLIAGGSFTTAGGVSANYIARWNGTSWSPLGTGMDNEVYALTVYNGKLIAGGYFTHANGILVDRVAQWDGSSWSPLA